MLVALEATFESDRLWSFPDPSSPLAGEQATWKNPTKRIPQS
jgi:hypothetical protein